MAVQNRMRPQYDQYDQYDQRNQMQAMPQLRDKAVEYKVNNETVKLSPSIVRNYLTNGNQDVTDQEVAMFINLCKYQKLNPLIKDAYLIKYGNQPATIVTSKDAILKRAVKNPRYQGHQAGVVVRNSNGTIEYRIGAFVMPDELLIGGWAKTYVKDYQNPIEVAVAFKEYAGYTKEGKLNSMWASKPGVMIRKVALTASLREAFPEDIQGMYAAEEVGESESVIEPAAIVQEPEIVEIQTDQESDDKQMTVDDIFQ